MIQETASIPQRLREIRQQSRRDISECAFLLDVSDERFQNYENGVAKLSLPEIELLSEFFGVPIQSFYQKDAPAVSYYSNLNEETKSKYKQLRNKVILAKLQIETEKKGVTLEDLHIKTAIPLEIIQDYVTGNVAISMKHLLRISEALEQPISIFFDHELRKQELEKTEPDQPQVHQEDKFEEDKTYQTDEAPDDPLTRAIRQMPVKEQAEIAKFILGKFKAQ